MIYPFFLAAVALASRASATCTRATLQGAATEYIKALISGQPPPTFSNVSYSENDTPIAFKSGVFSEPVAIDWSRIIYDTTQCATAIELNAASNKHPYVIVTRMLLVSDKVASIQSVVSDDGDWLFNATLHLQYAQQEKWDPIPEDKRDTREVLKAAADAYLDSWTDNTLPVPFGTPCTRLEGGLYTGAANSTANSCKMGVFPEKFKVGNRRYTIDEEYGAVDILNGFPWLEKTKPSTFETPSTNFYRVEGGKIRYIHEITICQTRNCGR
ncbi:hypothetical protein GQ53DRAFT_876359 [Thozetella sp. PMI_491]|nr:hypothetical protein GQ53DRAFT_876359 [Thozetella sp. PMI_491]